MSWTDLTKQPQVIDKTVDFEETRNDGLLIKHAQEIPDDFVSQLKRDKIDADHQPIGNFMRVASIPTVFVEQLAREGYDVFNEDVRDTVKKLKEKGLDAFVTTNKRI